MSICIYMNDELEKIDSYLKDITSHINMNHNEIICIPDNKEKAVLELLESYDKKFKNIFVYDSDESENNLPEKVNGEYILLCDIDTCFDQMKLNEAYDFSKNNKLDIMISSPKINNEYSAFYDDFTSIEGIFHPRTLSKELFFLPKNNFNLFKSSFIKENEISIPANPLEWNNINFYFESMFLAKKAGFHKEYMLLENESPLSLNKILGAVDCENGRKKSFEEFFKMIDKFLNFFTDNNMYRIYKYHILNTIFNYFREVYEFNSEDNECYFAGLKKRIEEFREENNSDLVLTLTSDNLKFYRNILDVNSTNELLLLDENERLEHENFMYHHLLDKFNTLILDLKNSNRENNRLEIEEFPQDTKHKIVLDKFKNADGSGLSVTSYNGSLHFKVRCIEEGNLKFYFRGFELKDKNSRRMPLSIDLTRIIVDDEIILDKNRVISYEKPFRYNKDVEDGEIIDIYVEWLPLNYKSNFRYEKSENPQLLPFNTARFDIKNKGSKNNDIKIVKNNDKNSTEYCPIWFNNDEGKGTIIESSKGKIDFTIRCINSGTVEITTRSMDFRDKNRTRVPIYVDLKKLKINNEIVLNENILVSHDKPFKFVKDVKNNEKLRIQAEWTPLTSKSTYEVEESSTLPLLLKPFTTARFDIKNKGTENNQIKILKNTDNKSKPRTPKWFTNKEGQGTIIESTKGKINIELQCINKGTLEIATRSIDFRDKNKKRIPLNIDLKKLTINNQPQINKNTLITHNKPIKYKKEVEDGEIIKIEAQWGPISYQSNYEDVEIAIPPELKPFTTARFDIKNKGTENNQIKILKNTDNKSKPRTPKWFTNKEGQGTIIESTKGKINIELQCINKGTLEIATRSIDFRDKNKKRIPLNIDLKKLTINNQPQINKNTLITHNKPIKYKKEVENNEIIKIEAEWAPITNKSLLED